MAGVALVIALKVLGAIAVRVVPSLTGFTAQDMKLHDFPRGNFQVELPGKPAMKTDRTKSNDLVTGYHLSRGGWQFMIEYFDIPANKTFGDQAQAAARANIQAMAKGWDLEPKGEIEDNYYQGEPGAELAFEGPKGAGVIRVVVREDTRMYVLLCASRNYDPEIAKRFLDSFNMYD